MKTRAFYLLAFAAGMQAVGIANASETITYFYDELGRIITVSSSGSVNDGQTVAISLDSEGNRINYSVSGVAVPIVSIGGASVTEGGNLSFNVTLSYAAPSNIAVNYDSSNGTAINPGDYAAISGGLTFTTGQSTKTITVATVDDNAVESSETMTITLSSPSGATLGTSIGTGTINDNDTAIATISIGGAVITEGGSLAFPLTRSGATSSAVSASFATNGGTATSGTDFSATSGTVSFSSGQTSNSILVPTIDDSSIELAETMTVTLANPSSGAAIGAATGTGTINDNDIGGAVIWISDATVTEGGVAVFTLTRTGDTSSTSSVSYETVSGTATTGADVYALQGTKSFSAGQTSKTISVGTYEDTISEGTETFSVVISNPIGSSIGNSSGNGTINDND